MAKILVTDGMDKAGIGTLKALGHTVDEQFYELDALKEIIGEYDCIVVRSATKVREALIDIAAKGKLKLIIRGGVGVDNIDVKYAESKGIKVRNTPKASSASVAELAIGHMFSLARHLYISNVTMRNGEWNKKQYKGIELAGKTLGLIGSGRIGLETAKRADALGMKVVYINHKMHEVDGPWTMVTKDELLGRSDFVSLHMPFIKEEGPAIGEAEFAKMKDGVYLVNCARGGVVDEAALVAALDSGKVAAAAVDVYEAEPTKNEALYSHPKVSMTPHIGASTAEAQKRIGEEIVDVIKEVL
jgi:D-3-phosphoglycerate dehydrogenase